MVMLSVLSAVCEPTILLHRDIIETLLGSRESSEDVKHASNNEASTNVN